MTVFPGSNIPGRDPEGWRDQEAGSHAVTRELAENERLLAESGIARGVPVWVWALLAAIVVGLVVVFLS